MIVGTAGHIDHGKTALVHALTGVDTDRLKEEKERGISIDLGFAYLPAPDGSIIGFIDVPGHERFVHTMVTGASGIDFVVLVVAADDGVMPQTLEHLAIIDMLGIQHGLVALTKVDLVTSGRREEAASEVAAVLSGTRLAGTSVIPVSSVTGEGIESLRHLLSEAARLFGRRSARGRFRLAIDRSFTLTGVGTVVTGAVLSGQLAVGDRVVVSPTGLAARVRSLHVQNRAAERSQAGDRCALNLVGEGITKEAVHRGDVVLDPELHAPADRIDATVRLLSSEAKPVSQWMPVRLHHAAAEVGARVVLLEDEALAPGCARRVQLVLEKPIAAVVGDCFVLRDTSSQRTIGGGHFLDLRAPARKRRTATRMAQLSALALEQPKDALCALLQQQPYYVDLAGFSRDHALSLDELARYVDDLHIVKISSDSHVIGTSASTWERLRDAVVSTLQAFHTTNPDRPGMGIDRLRLQLEPRLPGPAFLQVLQAMTRSADVVLNGATVRITRHEMQLTPKDQQLWARLTPLLSEAERFRPPRVGDIEKLLNVKASEVRRLAKVVARMGKLDEIAPDHFFLHDTVLEMVQIAVDLARAGEGGEFTAGQFRDRLNNGRKVAIQILEFFDRHGVTLRRGDLRRINKNKLDLFRASKSATGPVVSDQGRESSPVGRPDFKSGRGREPVLGGFDSHSLPPQMGNKR